MSLDPLDVPAAMAALHAAWAEMRALALRLEPLEPLVQRGEMGPWECGLAQLMDELYAGDEKALFEIGIFDREELRPAQVEALLTRYPKGESDYYADQLMQADATIADYHRGHAAQQLGLLERLEGATPEQMDAWTPGAGGGVLRRPQPAPRGARSAPWPAAHRGAARLGAPPGLVDGVCFQGKPLRSGCSAHKHAGGAPVPRRACGQYQHVALTTGRRLPTV
jgi:hypothetical protein